MNPVDQPATGAWMSQLVLNAAETKVSTAIKFELQTCTSFRFYVAFLNPAGYATLQQELHDCAGRGVRGKVLVSQYQNFTHPHALRQLMQLDNIDLRIETRRSMHAKGYFFTHGSEERYIIGSSNWTDSGLSRNQELNVICKTPAGSALQQDVAVLFDREFERAQPVTAEYCRWYEGVWTPLRLRYKTTVTLPLVAEPGDDVRPSGLPVPNKMQEEGLAALRKLVAAGERRALVISATGTGKTYLAAFFVRELKARRVLFVVHRERIARQAKASFEAVLGPSKACGLYIGAEADTRSDFIFSTVQTLSRPHRLSAFAPDDFDCIIVDESHRAGAKTYERFLNHFRPNQFLLGMTATPERTDGLDIFKWFDHNVAFEIRLQRALEEELLCPFHYYGISDITIDDELIDEKSDFNKLTADVRVDHIVSTIARYGCCEQRVRGLMFCSRNEEAARLSEALNRRGLRTLAISGATSEADREAAIARLESDGPDGLDHLLTVDIFNEGVDIPGVNLITMLRPTQSAIVFVQQLGRGLRKANNPDKYLTVLDFIGNYENNFLIPAALYGDTTWNKDKLRRLVVAGNDALPGSSTVNFDRVTKERIFESINRARNTGLRDLKQDFEAMRMRLGRVPMMMDWHQQGGRDPMLFAAAAKGSYVGFIAKHFPTRISPLGADFAGAIEVWTKDALSGTSIEEPTLVRLLFERGACRMEEVLGQLADMGYPSTEGRIRSAVRALNLGFLRTRQGGDMVPFADVYGGDWVEAADGQLGWGGLVRALGEEERRWMLDLALTAQAQFTSSHPPHRWRNGFCLGAKYRRSDVFRILGHQHNPVAQNVGGYLMDSSAGHCPIFVTYHKQADISESTQYEDAFLDPRTMHWFSKSNRNLNSADVRFFREASRGSGSRLPLFVKKSDDEGIDFYFLGDVTPVAGSFTQDTMPAAKGKTTGPSVVRMNMHLHDPVPTDLYHYFTATETL